MSSFKLEKLLAWLTEHNIMMHKDIIICDNAEMGLAIISKQDIHHPDTITAIPKTSVLSVRTCSLAHQIGWHPYGHGAVLALAFALYSEQLLGIRSRWHPYLQSLPISTIPIARLWGNIVAFDDRDAVDAAEWIAGSEIQRELQNDEGGSLQKEMDRYFISEVHPVLSSLGMRPTHKGFLRAYSLVCSRAFQIDSYHGLSMVPLADVFNHHQENHVQLASEYDVCPSCGSLAECLHDRDDETQANGAIPSSIDNTDTVDMVTVRSIPSGVEVFNTYGNLGNAALLARYGFVLNGAEVDTITFGWPGSSLELGSAGSAWRSIYGLVAGSAEAIIARNSLLYLPDAGSERIPLLSIDSDGRVSLALFIWALVECISAERAATLVVSVLHLLLEVEAVIQAGESEHMIEMTSNVVTARLLGRTAERLSNLCRTRSSNMGHPQYRGVSMEEIGGVMDGLTADSPKTRLALECVLGERAILEACTAGWEEVQNIAEAGGL